MLEVTKGTLSFTTALPEGPVLDWYGSFVDPGCEREMRSEGGANQKTVPVVVYTGAVDCVEAVVVARPYFAEALHNTRGPEGS